MSNVTFYTHITHRQHFACRLVQRVLSEAVPLLVLLEDSTAVADFSHELWHFADNSFLAHDVWLSGSPLPQNSPVILSNGFDDIDVKRLPETILNLSENICINPHFSRILELVAADEAALSAARLRFAAYRKAGLTLTHHSMQGRAS